MIITSPKTETEFKAYYNLRWRILRQPWAEPEGSERDKVDDKKNDDCYHIIAIEKNIIYGVARLEFLTNHQAQLRYMAVDTHAQGKGIGRKIIEHVENYARDKSITELFLNARNNALAFYEKQGYKVTEKSYLLFDSIQHYKMTKTL